MVDYRTERFEERFPAGSFHAIVDSIGGASLPRRPSGALLFLLSVEKHVQSKRFQCLVSVAPCRLLVPPGASRCPGAGSYWTRGRRLLRPGGHYAHVLTGAWLPRTPFLLNFQLEALAAAAGCARLHSSRGRCKGGQAAAACALGSCAELLALRAPAADSFGLTDCPAGGRSKASALLHGSSYGWVFVQPSGRQMAQVAELMAAGSLRLHVARTFPLEQARCPSLLPNRTRSCPVAGELLSMLTCCRGH